MLIKAYKTKFYLGLLIFISIVFIVLIYPNFSQIGTDTALYAIMGKNFIEGSGLTLWGIPHTIFSPLLPLVIGMFYKLAGNLELSAHLATFFFAIASIPALYYLIKIITEKDSVAIVGSSFLTFNGYIVWQYSIIPTPQILVGFISIITFIAVLKTLKLGGGMKSRNFIWLFLTGVCIGLSYLTRPEYFIMIFPFLFLIYFSYKKKNIDIKVICFSLLFILLGFLFISLPYILFLYDNLGYWTISGRGSEMALQLAGTNYENIDSIAQGHDLNNALVSAPKIPENTITSLINNLVPLTKNFFDSLQIIENNFMKSFGIIGMIFFTIGLASTFLLKQYVYIVISGILLIPIFAIALFQGGSINYLIQFFYIFIIFISIGFITFYDYLKNTLTNKKLISVIIAFSFIFTLSYFFSPVLKNYLFLPTDYQPKEFKLMGLWMKDTITDIENQTVISRKPDISFYSGSRWQLIPLDADVENIPNFMDKNNIKYLIVDERTLFKQYTDFNLLINNKKPIDGLSFLKEFEYEGNSILLFSAK